MKKDIDNLAIYLRDKGDTKGAEFVNQVVKDIELVDGYFTDANLTPTIGLPDGMPERELIVTAIAIALAIGRK